MGVHAPYIPPTPKITPFDSQCNMTACLGNVATVSVSDPTKD